MKMTKRDLSVVTEKKLYECVVALREEVDRLIDGALAMPATIELCLFTGKLSAAYDILLTLEAAGVPVHDPRHSLEDEGEATP
jgi:hypothetical protein